MKLWTRLGSALTLALTFGCGVDESPGSSAGGSGGAAGGAPPGGSGGDTSGGGAGGDGEGGMGMALPSECQGLPMPPRADHPEWNSADSALEPYFPTTDFRDADPAALGIDPTLLAEALDYAPPGASTQALLVLRHGYVVAERYTAPFTADSRHESFSMAKSVSSALIGILIDQGLLANQDERLCNHYDEWTCDDPADLHGVITLRHAMNVSTGLEWVEDWRSGREGANDVYRGFADLLNYVLAKPVVEPPGTVMRYSTGDPALLSGVIQNLAGMNALAFAEDVLFGPLGISGVSWSQDAQGRTTTFANLQITAREIAKIGYLYLRNGMWDGTRVVSEAWVSSTTRPADVCTIAYQDLWHQNLPLRLGTEDLTCSGFLECPPTELANLPVSGFFMEGVSGQFVFVLPSLDIVAVRLAQDAAGSENWDAYARGFLERLFAAAEG